MSQPIRVDFYLLTSNKESLRELLTCYLLEKAYAKGHEVFVYCENQKEAENLDLKLWTFKDESFLPHSLQDENTSSPIQIGWREPKTRDLLLNLTQKVPGFYSQFQRVIELVGFDPQAKALSRDHYKLYRQAQCELHTHHWPT